jgi:hypothetical protein
VNWRILKVTYCLPLKVKIKLALPWFWWLIIGLSLWRPGLNLTVVQVGFVTKWHGDRIFSRYFKCNYQCNSITVSYSYFIHLPMYYEQLKALLNKTLSCPSVEMKCTVNILQSEAIHCSLCWGPNENQKSY